MPMLYSSKANNLQIISSICWKIELLYSKIAFEKKLNFQAFLKNAFWHFLEQKSQRILF